MVRTTEPVLSREDLLPDEPRNARPLQGRGELSRGWPGPGAASPDERLTVTVDRAPPRTVVSVTGDLDVTGASLLGAVLEHVGERDGLPVVVDLSGVRSADSHGIAPVLDGRTEIRAASAAVRRVLRVLDRPVPGPRWADAAGDR